MDSLRIKVSRYRLAFASAAIVLALVLLLTITMGHVFGDLRSHERELLLREIQDVRSRALRTVGGIEQILESRGGAGLEGLDRGNPLGAVRDLVASDPGRYAYAALVNPQGVIDWHADPRQQGRQLEREWYESVEHDLGADVVRTQSAVLAGGRMAYDLRVPVVLGGRNVGSYHLGLDQEGVGKQLIQKRRAPRMVHGVWMGAIVLVVAAAAVSLYDLTWRLLVLEKAVSRTYMRAVAELGRLAAGLAHEIRNPLQAVRLNLHAFRRAQRDTRVLPPSEVARMLEQSSREIDRIDQLLRQLIDFAIPEEPRTETFHLNTELEGVVDFIGQELHRSGIEIQLDLPESPISVRMDRARLRQIMLNLLHNARDAMPDGGRIEVSLVRKDAQVEISVADRGGGLADADRPHIFEPFFTTKDEGTGLGLALVKRFVEEAGGDIRCQANAPHGTRFCIRLREASSSASLGSV
jgi:two-component system, NtrC family, sensor histidine kinase HydH